MIKKTLVVLIAALALGGCDALLSAEDHGPPIAKADVAIARVDVEQVLNASRKFAAEHGLRLEAANDTSGFRIFMQRGDLSIFAHNKIESTRVEIGASDEGRMSEANKKIANDYIALLMKVSIE